MLRKILGQAVLWLEISIFALALVCIGVYLITWTGR